MIKKDELQNRIKCIVCICSLLLTGCGSIGLAQEATFESAYENEPPQEPVDIYTSQTTAVIEAVNLESQTIRVYLTERNESREFTYTGATLINDKYGASMSMAQLMPGDIAEIKYNSELEEAGSIALSGDAWSYEDVTKYTFDEASGNATIGDEFFSLDGKVQVFSDGKKIEIAQIIKQDVLTFQGKGHTIMSITVDKGHGYLKLINDEAVLGGWMEIGQTIITQIAPDMLITVPEGSYSVRLSSAGVEETREVTIERNRETSLNLGDIEIPEPENGVVTLKVTPQSAQVYVDDTEVETTYPVRLSLGLHQITAKAEGYDTISEYFEVGAEGAVVKLDLTEKKEVSGNSISSYQESSTITISLPADTEVYQDNLYMGIAPVTYTKTAGTHTITLRKEGYITRSYSIEVPDDGKDVTYSFPDLDPESSENTVSGNTVSGNAINSDSTDSSSSTDNTVSGNTVSGNSVNDNNEALGNQQADKQ